MKAIQLELFDTKMIEPKYFSIKKRAQWILIDNVRKRFANDKILDKSKYPLVVNTETKKVFDGTSFNDIYFGDKLAIKINIETYFLVSNIIKNNKKFYNKKTHKLYEKDKDY